MLHDLKEVKLKDFQFKLNNKILTTKSFLYRINKVDNDTCSYCEHNSETLKHRFVDCQKVKEFWDDLKVWLQTHANLSINISDKSLIFSWQKEKSFMNYLLVVAKYYIYKTKFTSRRLNIAGFKSLLKKKFDGEKYIAKINNRYDKFLGKWSPLYNLLNNV